MQKSILFLLLASVTSLPVAAQIQPKPLVTQGIDESALITLKGSAQTLVRAGNDRGAVADSFSAGRMLLLLNRPPKREAALKQFLEDVHARGSASYHEWLTPEQFGEQFGPADSDLKTASAWLASHGLNVGRISKSRQFMEFSGTAGALRSAFHTEIHQYLVNGETHYANASELRIPEALALLVKGVSPMNDFRAQPEVQVVGKGQIARGPRPAEPLWTAPNQYGTSSPYEFTVTPEDLATQYDLGPLYQAGVNGAGQTIGIINESNIDLGLVQDFQKLFGVNGTTPQVVIDGDDPGNLEGVDVEAYLDVEVSGAVAPKATVYLYIGGAGGLLDPFNLAALRAVEDNQASVLSVSFGGCESGLGDAGNQFWESLWAEAAAQGQTVLVSAGDSGAVCVPPTVPGYPAVSGLASTPWNVAMGGTDFYYSDYASGGASATTLWNTTNDANLGSLKAPLTEQVWDGAFGFNLISGIIQNGEPEFNAEGGGGASNCVTETVTNNQIQCTAGYAKPSWQTGPGVPADGVRDIPDVSLFASNGANLSAIAICASEGECAAGSGGNAEVLLVGGTSASAPAMAGIMALVDQKYGRQGQADFVLYPLSQQKPAAFHDITLGGNYYYPCGYPTGASDPNCALQWNGFYGTKLYAAGPGYDMASGLGSVDAAVLVNDWNAISFQPTSTSLELSSSSIVHGTPVTITTSVAPMTGSGTPTGNVAVLTSAALPANQSQTAIPLNNGSGSSSVNFLPGGEYQVTGRYGGDGTFAGSTSQPVSLTVTPEASNINFWMFTNSGNVAPESAVGYAQTFQLNVQPAAVNANLQVANPVATGTATFSIDSTSESVALNSEGTASWIPPALSIGPHTASASYSGDPSFKASSATPVNFTVTPGLVFMGINFIGPYSGGAFYTGSSVTIGVTAQGNFTRGVNPAMIPLGTAAPTGTVQVCLTTSIYSSNACLRPDFSQTVTLAPVNGAMAYMSTAAATFPNLAAGEYDLTLIYSGDSHWQASEEDDIQAFAVWAPSPYAATTTTLNITPASISGTQTAKVTATVTGSGNPGTSPTGEVDFYDNDVYLTYADLPAGVSGTTGTVAFNVTPGSLLTNGANTFTAV